MPSAAAAPAEMFGSCEGGFGGRPAGFRRAPLVRCQPACKPGSGGPANQVRRRDGHSSGTPVTRRLKQPTRTAGSGHDPEAFASRRPYSVLLPVGFAVPPALPPTRCALTAPFHPCHGKTLRAAAVCSLWHCPWVRTRRTLSGTACPWSPDFPPRRPFGFAGAAVRPTDIPGMGTKALAVKRFQPRAVKERPPPR